MSNLTAALTQVSDEVNRIMAAGQPARLLDLEVRLDPDTAPDLLATLEFDSGDLFGVTFSDSEHWTAERREELELIFAAAATMKAVLCEADRAG